MQLNLHFKETQSSVGGTGGAGFEVGDHRPELAPLSDVLRKLSVSDDMITYFVHELSRCGFSDTDRLVLFAKAFALRPEVLSDILQKDFNFKPFDAHLLRTALSELIVNTDMIPIDLNDGDIKPTTSISPMSNKDTLEKFNFKSSSVNRTSYGSVKVRPLKYAKKSDWKNEYGMNSEVGNQLIDTVTLARVTEKYPKLFYPKTVTT